MLQSGNEQCFMIEQPQGTPVTVDYDLPAYATQSLNLVISLVSGPGGKGGGGKMVQQVQMNEEKGQFKFATVKDGFHSLCIVPHTVTKPTKVGLEVTYGKSDAYYADLAKEAHIDLLEASIMHLNAQMGQILNEADYMKDKEVLFHQQCERTNSAARWWPILQVGILLVTGVLQVNNLKQFFKARRLV
ncbi:hypothetical protein NSK_000625 [Nannochloropsis salina CCMP1776]|uniref:GOLD domain-containing protein n=1 Tax=Nannochloropsis salina CCMP1776 TaxID=1027361 RepID=A0A4D9DAC2_9STRA|nr:hypothetical protein NSK_000625 [Nannochloropsis salina CCMP1776]|eukprot:TFJ88276.1 hypothetical protein NSK_000625 [Nannochloropsis salina CCMP1776]